MDIFLFNSLLGRGDLYISVSFCIVILSIMTVGVCWYQSRHEQGY